VQLSHRWYLVPLLLAASAVACNDATAPQTEMRRAGRAAATHTDAIAKGLIVKRTTTLVADEVVTTTVTPAGGWLYMPQAGLYLYFPQGAVSSDLVVTATAHAGSRVTYDFQPHGTVFATPVYIAQLLLNTELNTPRAKNRRPDVWGGYLSHGLEDVEVDGTGYFSEVFNAAYGGKGSETYAVFTTTHFSGYALASGRRESANNDGL
jgi:hypothetical protein